MKPDSVRKIPIRGPKIEPRLNSPKKSYIINISSNNIYENT